MKWREALGLPVSASGERAQARGLLTRGAFAAPLTLSPGGSGTAALVSPLWRGGQFASVALAAAALLTAPARADLRVCNNTHMLVNFAVGVYAGEHFATEGWWTMTPGSCSTPVRGALPGRYVYLYAIDIDAVDVLAGKVSMCVDRAKFKVYGIADCWRRGLQAVNFAEIDTGGSPDWTAFLNEPRK